MEADLKSESVEHEQPLVQRNTGKSHLSTGLYEQLKTDFEYRIKFLTFLSLTWSFFILGWILGQFGPSIYDLQIITKTDLEVASYFYMSHNIGYLIGSSVSGFLIGRFDCNFILCITMTIYGVSLTTIPWCFLPWIMIMAHAVRGLCGGILDTAANHELLSLFGNKVTPYMQAMHFFFAVGGIVSPIVTAPFLADEYVKSENLPSGEMNNVALSGNMTINISTYVSYNASNPLYKESIIFTVTNETTIKRNIESLRLFIPYTMSGVLAFTSAVSFVLIYIQSKQRKQKTNEKNTEVFRNERKLNTSSKALILVVMSFLFLLYTAMEDTVGAYVATFCVEQTHMTTKQASYVTAVFWGLFAFGRLSGIPIGKKVRPIPLVGIYSLLLMLSFLLLCLVPMINSVSIVWISTSVSGLAMSILFPTLLTWTEEDFILVTGKIASLFIMTSTCGSIVSPPALGYLIEEISPMWYSYILVGESLGMILFFIIAVFIKRHLPPISNKKENET